MNNQIISAHLNMNTFIQSEIVGPLTKRVLEKVLEEIPFFIEDIIYQESLKLNAEIRATPRILKDMPVQLNFDGKVNEKC